MCFEERNKTDTILGKYLKNVFHRSCTIVSLESQLKNGDLEVSIGGGEECNVKMWSATNSVIWIGEQ